jgi:two-component sensor histidine kinase
VRTADGRVLEWLGTSTDVDDILRLQARKGRTGRGTAAPHPQSDGGGAIGDAAHAQGQLNRSTSFAAQIDARMQALARAQGVLSRRDAGSRVTFDTAARGAFSACSGSAPNGNWAQVSIDGPPDIPLHSSLVQTFALALHELRPTPSNMARSPRRTGILSVRWEELHRDGDGAPRLHVDWRESGVSDMPDASAAPRGGGYGRELIERALPYQLGAQTRFAFMPDGVHCTIEVDIPQRADEAEMIDA